MDGYNYIVPISLVAIIIKTYKNIVLFHTRIPILKFIIPYFKIQWAPMEVSFIVMVCTDIYSKQPFKEELQIMVVQYM